MWQIWFSNNSAYCDSLRHKPIYHLLIHILEVKEEKKVIHEKKIIPEIKKKGRLLKTCSGYQGVGRHIPMNSFQKMYNQLLYIQQLNVKFVSFFKE